MPSYLQSESPRHGAFRIFSRRLAVSLASLTAIAVTSSAAFAQNGADTVADEEEVCNPATVPTQALGRATLSLQRAFQLIQTNETILKMDSADRVDSLGRPLTLRDPKVELMAAISALTGPADKRDRGANDSLGRAYYLGQAYILMLEQPGVDPIGERRDYGIATDSTFTIDLLAAADTLFTKVEEAYPVCVAELARWRQQRPWLDALNGSITALNEGELDSAEYLAKRSLLIDRTTPYPYSILGKVYKQRQDFDQAIEYFNKTISMVEESGDAELEGDKVDALYDLADVATLRAQDASGPEKKAAVTEAINAWNTFFPAGGRDVQVASGIETIRRLLESIDETDSLTLAYAAIIAEPEKYGEAALLNAGMVATKAGRYDDAGTLFAAVLKANPYQRDALNNVSASYVNNKQFDDLLQYVDRLVEVDPNNSNNWLYYAFAYRNKLEGVKEPDPRVKQYTDSLVKYTTKSDKLPAEVYLSGFSHSSRETTLSGTITNKTKESKTYDFVVEFLDNKGEVLGTETVKVGPVLPDTSEPFTVTLKGQDAVAFRYKPLT